MSEFEKRKKVKKFVEFWENHSKVEKQDDQTFWNMFLRDVLDINDQEKVIKYQAETDSNKTNWIDAWIKSTGVIIEQKSGGVDLLKQTRQSDGTYKNAFEQAKNYDNNMNKSNKSNWIITCNFDKFLIYNMNDLKKEYIEINLEDLPSCYDNFKFMVDKNAVPHDLEVTVSKEAGKIIGNIYDEIKNTLIEYNMNTPEKLKDLNAFCVRLVFCCFAEDSGLFAKGQFRNFISNTDVNHLQNDLLLLFEVLNQKERNPFLRDDLKLFPYVNGELFSEKIDIPPLNEKIKKYILEDACDGFDWSKINPTIFGAIFESTLNPETRRTGGMHYTSIENIHKVIDPLFLDKLKQEFSDIRKSSQVNKKLERLENLQDKISKLTFLDPACGSGNFLTETYLELRRLENNIIREKINVNHGQSALFYGKNNELIKVHIQQFYGIEINDFAVAVSKTALWIAEYQMWLETKSLDYHNNLKSFLPLDSYDNIIEGNALSTDWNTVIRSSKLNYIMGNPPFVGHKNVDMVQKQDMIRIFEGKQGRLDYVSAWYLIAAKYMSKTNIECAFVSTNSIVQGVHLEQLWKPLLDKYNIHINFACQTFPWVSNTTVMAHVHCVIIGFSLEDKNEKYLFIDSDKDGKQKKIKVAYINPYLTEEMTNTIIESRNKPICKVSEMVYGNIPRDGGHYTFETEEDKNNFIKNEPLSEKYIYKFIGSREFINGYNRWVLFLKDCPPNELRQMPLVMDRVNKVREFRLSSKADEIKKFAETPTLFAQITQPLNTDYIVVPIVSSQRRKYIPIGFINDDTITNNAVQIIPNATIYDFGIITSIVHMAWMRVTASRLKSDYRYLKNVVYNNFPWPSVNEIQKSKIIKTAQNILDVRKKYIDCSLADLYDITSMPPELSKAHQENDQAVLEAYGLWKNSTEEEIVSKLMEMYKKIRDEKTN